MGYLIWLLNSNEISWLCSVLSCSKNKITVLFLERGNRWNFSCMRSKFLSKSALGCNDNINDVCRGELLLLSFRDTLVVTRCFKIWPKWSHTICLSCHVPLTPQLSNKGPGPMLVLEKQFLNNFKLLLQCWYSLRSQNRTLLIGQMQASPSPNSQTTIILNRMCKCFYLSGDLLTKRKN